MRSSRDQLCFTSEVWGQRQLGLVLASAKSLIGNSPFVTNGTAERIYLMPEDVGYGVSSLVAAVEAREVASRFCNTFELWQSILPFYFLKEMIFMFYQELVALSVLYTRFSWQLGYTLISCRTLNTTWKEHTNIPKQWKNKQPDQGFQARSCLTGFFLTGSVNQPGNSTIGNCSVILCNSLSRNCSDSFTIHTEWCSEV